MLTNIYKKTQTVILDQRNLSGPSLHLSQHRGEQLVLSGHDDQRPNKYWNKDTNFSIDGFVMYKRR
jgi:hypothetical protein